MNTSTAANVTAEIFSLTRSDLDSPEAGCGPFIPFSRVVDETDPFRITRLSEFWRATNGTSDPEELTRRFDDVISGWYGLQEPWAFIVRGHGSGIACGFATPRITATKYAESLIGALPGVDAVRSWGPFDDGWQPAANESLSLTGLPTRKSDALEKLSRGLYGRDWAYMVFAHPVPAKDVRIQGLSFDAHTSEMQQSFLYKDAVPNRMAERLIEMLERQTKRFEVARTMGMWSVYAVLSVRGGGETLDLARGLVRAAFAGKKSIPEPFRARSFAGSPAQDNTWTQLTTTELATLVTLPREDQPGFEILPDTRFGVQPVNREDGAAVDLGEILDRGHGTGNRLSISMSDLTKHGLIVGVTGSGKTNTCFELLAQIWNAGNGVPFMVLESAKSEYRDLLHDPRFTDLRVFTIGDETVAPLRLNPFEVAPGILVQSHIDYLKALFGAAFVLYPPMPYVLDQALHEIYEDYGWDLATNENRRGGHGAALFPTLDDLVEKTRAVVKGLGYDTRLEMDVQAGLTARLDSLRRGGGKGPMLNTRVSVSDADLFEHPCILELKQIVSDDEKAFFIGLLLIKLHEYYESGPSHTHDGGLRHVTLIEEAHRLLRNVGTDQNSDVSANPKGQAIEVFGNMLAEIRAFGEGVLIAEQVPTKLLPDAIKNTNLKVVHRMVSADDRAVVGKTMNLTDEQSGFLTTLRTGEAIAYAEGAGKPTRLQIALAPVKRSGGRVDAALVRAQMSAFYRGRPWLRFPHALCAQCSAVGPDVSCGVGKRSTEKANSLARHLLSAIRFGEPSVEQHYRALLRELSSESNPAEAARCIFAKVSTSDLFLRAAKYGWSDPQVQHLEHLIASAFDALQDGIEGGAALVRATKAFSDLESRDIGPLTGCAACSERCRFRYDVSADGQAFSNRYKSMFSGGATEFETGWKSFVEYLKGAANESVPGLTGSRANAASLCIAVQAMEGLGLPQIEQEFVIKRLALSNND